MNFLRRLNFNLWYFGRPPWDRGISPPELLEYIDTHFPGRAIDLGCGTGTNVITLARAGWKATGVDFAPRAIALARRKARLAGVDVSLRVGDVTRLTGVQGRFDLALDMGCFHNVTDRQAYLAELLRILAPGGSWLLYGFFKPSAEESGPGLTESDVEGIPSRLQLLWRRDGTDARGRPSAWFHFSKS
ncbi:MAG: class I SAM-dependent methyltransferase [Bacteroidota bacterium]